MDDCNYIGECCFFNKFHAAESLLWQSQLRTYCLGPLYQRCERRRFFLETGDCAPPHITPSGEVAEVFFTLK